MYRLHLVLLSQKPQLRMFEPLSHVDSHVVSHVDRAHNELHSATALCGTSFHDSQSKPFLSYGVLVVNLAVYSAGLAVRFTLGEPSGEDYFYMLAKVNDEVVQGEYYR